MVCAACIKRGKTWSGDEPKCSFAAGPFNPEGWNCATAGMVRDVVYEAYPHPLVDYRYCDDQKFATIDLHAMPNFDGLALWVTWYKNRGRTEAMWVLSSHRAPRPPTEAECIEIFEYANSVHPVEQD